MTDQLPEPLTPPDCDLQDFPFMPLHVARLRDSDLAAEENPEACWYAVMLWAASWHQLPAASLPDNDAVLARLVGLGRDHRTWKKHKAAALRGFALCADGRLYHPVVAEQAVIAWESKLQQRWRTECARIKKHNQRNETALPTPTFEEFLSAGHATPRPEFVREDVPRDNGPCPPGNDVQETETETETGTGIGIGTGTGTGKEYEPVGSSPEGPSISEFVDRLWASAPRQARERSSRKDVERALRAALKRNHEAETIIDGVARYFASDQATKDGGEYAKGVHRMIENDRWAEFRPALAAEGHATDAGELDAETFRIRKERVWMEDWRAGGRAQWKVHERGPYPGTPGCRVRATIQREFGVEPAAPELVPGSAVA